jgi:hypothetical protein
MKKSFVLSLSSLALIFSASPSGAIDLVSSQNNLRLNNTNTSTSFTVTLSDDISGLKGSGFIPAKLKIKSKNISTDLSKNKILIPYTDGVIGTSDPITLSLKEANILESTKVALKIKVPKKYIKKYKVKNFSDKISVDAEAVQISGKVTVPSQSVSSFKTKTLKKLNNMRAKGITPFNTENPEGVIVDLVPIDPNTGEASGEPIVSAITDAEGNFDMEMPSEVDFGTDYALIVEGENEEMHSPLFSDEVDINPATEALFELTQDAIDDPSLVGLEPGDDISFENFTDTEAEGLNKQMEELNPIYEDTLEESVQSIKDSYADFLNNMIGVASDDDTSSEANDLDLVAKGVAGDYNVVFFNTRITSEERIDLSIQLTGARMSKPDAVGALTVTPTPSFSTSASLFGQSNDGSDDNNQDGNNDNNQDGNDGGDASALLTENEESFACYGIEASSEVSSEIRGGDGSGNFYMTVDQNKIISFAEPAFEESISNPDGIYTFRTQPSVMNMIPVGEDMYLSSMLSIGKAISPTDEVEFEYDAGFGSIIKKSNFKEGDLQGTYGIVGLGYEVGDSSYGARSFLGNLIFEGSSVNFDIFQSYRNVNNIDCGSSFALESGDEDIQGIASLKFQGDRVSIDVDDDATDDDTSDGDVDNGGDVNDHDGDENHDDGSNDDNSENNNDGDPNTEGKSSTNSLFTGFARPDSKILTLAYSRDDGRKSSKQNQIDSAERQIIFGVKKPTSLVNLSGKTYRILSLNFEFNAEGGRTIERGEVGTLAFTGSTADVTGLTKTSFAKETGDSKSIETSDSVTTESGLAYTLTADGAVSLNIGTEELTGFVADDLSLIVFNVDGDSNLGIYLAVLQ